MAGVLSPARGEVVPFFCLLGGVGKSRTDPSRATALREQPPRKTPGLTVRQTHAGLAIVGRLHQSSEKGKSNDPRRHFLAVHAPRQRLFAVDAEYHRPGHDQRLATLALSAATGLKSFAGKRRRLRDRKSVEAKVPVKSNPRRAINIEGKKVWLEETMRAT